MHALKYLRHVLVSVGSEALYSTTHPYESECNKLCSQFAMDRSSSFISWAGTSIDGEAQGMEYLNVQEAHGLTALLLLHQAVYSSLLMRLCCHCCLS
jgi:hypothetical protein